MKIFIAPLALSLILVLAGCGASAEKLNGSGNDAFNNQNYDAALAAYQQAQTKSPELAEPDYNAANAYYRQNNFAQAQQEIEQALVKDKGKLAQNSLYNLGNTLLQKKEFDTAIESYKESLRLNPDDVEAKQNLELALRQQEQQQQDQQKQDQQQQDQQQQDQSKQDQQQQDQQKQDQQQQDQQQDQQNQDQQNQPNGNPSQPQQDQQQAQGQPQQDQQKQDQQQPNGNPSQPQQDQQQAQGQPQQVEGLTKDQARQLFEAATHDAQNLEQYLQQNSAAPQSPTAEDW